MVFSTLLITAGEEQRGQKDIEGAKQQAAAHVDEKDPTLAAVTATEQEDFINNDQDDIDGGYGTPQQGSPKHDPKYSPSPDSPSTHGGTFTPDPTLPTMAQESGSKEGESDPETTVQAQRKAASVPKQQSMRQ